MVWMAGGQEEFFKEAPPSFVSFFSLLNLDSPKNSALSNTSWPPSLGVFPSLGPEAILDPDALGFGEVG